MNEITLIFLLTLFLLSNANANNSCSDPNYMSGRRNVTISVNGLERLFELYIPFRARSDCGEYCTGPPSKPTRGLVLNWHGCNAHQPILEYHTEISKVTEEAMTRSYYTITPLGTRTIEGTYGWNADGIPCGTIGVNDWDFFEAIYKYIDTKLCVDMKKIYTVGFSTGAFISYGLACRYPDLIAAAGTDAGELSKPYLEVCGRGSGAVPIQSFHSLTDPTVPYNGTVAWASQEEVDNMWKIRNGCDGSEIPISTYYSDTTSCSIYNCKDAPVETCVYQNIDHCWYGGRSGGFPSCQPRVTDLDATKHMFDFWEQL